MNFLNNCRQFFKTPEEMFQPGQCVYHKLTKEAMLVLPDERRNRFHGETVVRTKNMERVVMYDWELQEELPS